MKDIIIIIGALKTCFTVHNFIRAIFYASLKKHLLRLG